MKISVQEGPSLKEKKPSAYKPIVPAVDQALQLLMYLSENTETSLTLTEICDRIGIHKSKGYTLLNTLKQYDLIQKDERTKTYHLGLGIIHLARNVLDNMDINTYAAPYLAKLADESQSTAHLLTVTRDMVYVTSIHEGSPDIGFTLRKGHQYPLTHGAHGRAIAAFLSEEPCRKLLSGDSLRFYGEGKAFDAVRLKKDLEIIRKKGYALDQGEIIQGITTISSPIFQKNGEIVGCVMLFGVFIDPNSDDFGIKVRDTAIRISAALGADTARCYHPVHELPL
jgi:DNA-binding IclR family transcriptional regulator